MVLGLSSPWAAGGQAVDKYGEFMVLNTLLWLPSYFAAEEMALHMLKIPPQDHIMVIRALREAAVKILKSSVHEDIVQRLGGVAARHHFTAKSIVQFQREATGVFDLEGAPAPRYAVTGDAINSPIIFNLDRISNPQTFGYEQALRLWIHELSHKVNFDKALVDKTAADFGRLFGSQVELNNSFMLFNGTPFQLPGSDLISPVHSHYPTRKWNRLAVIHNQRLQDLTEPFNAQLDQLARSTANFFEVDRIVQNLKVNAAGNFTADILTFRYPKNQTQYMITDLGGPHRFTVEIKMDYSAAEPRIKVLSYGEVRRQLQRAPDAGLEILDLTTEGSTIKGRLRIRVYTDQYWHGASYPTHYSARLLLKSGTNVSEVPLEIRANMSEKSWSSFPGEIFQTETLKHGRFSGELPRDWPAQFEVIGMVDEFFGMGSAAVGHTIPMLISMDQPFHYNGCEGNLLPPVGSN